MSKFVTCGKRKIWNVDSCRVIVKRGFGTELRLHGSRFEYGLYIEEFPL